MLAKHCSSSLACYEPHKDIPEVDQEALKAEYVKFIDLCQKALEINVENSTDPRSVYLPVEIACTCHQDLS